MNTRVLRNLLYGLTIYFPLRIRELCINSLALVVSREYINRVSWRLFKDRELIGMLPDGNLLLYPLDDLKVLPIISEIYRKNIYRAGQTESFHLVCDVGAHIGLFTLKMSKQAPNSRIIAIEPNPTNFSFLTRNIRINGLASRVSPLNVAAGKKRKKALLFTNYISRGDASMKKWHDAGTYGRSEIDEVPLAEILSNAQSVDLMKIDVEGMEEEVLDGLRDQNSKVRRVVIEIHTSIVHVADIFEWLTNHRFLIRRSQKLYDDCVIVEADRLCM